MSEVDTADPAVAVPDTEAPRRLRATVHARTLQGHGVAVSAGHSAVVLDGRAAEQLWEALHPVLVAGTSKDALLGRVPQTARGAVDRLWEQLTDHGLLCAATGAPDRSGDGVLAAHFERTAPDPSAALRAAGRSTALLAGDPGLVAEISEALAGTGLPTVDGGATLSEPVAWLRSPGARIAQLTVDHSADTTGSATVILVRAGDWSLVGTWPTDTGRQRAITDWTRTRAAQAGPGPADGRAALADRLAAAQTVLRALAQIAQPGGAHQGRYLVTTPDVVSEEHALLVLPEGEPLEEPLLHEVLLAEPGGTDGTALGLDDQLRDLEPLWNGPLTTWHGPTPGDLPQVPLGLATASDGATTVIGVGLNTADARMSCVEQLSSHRTGHPVGRDPLTAAASAITDWALRRLSFTGAIEPAPLSPTVRRFTQALLLREGVQVSTSCRSADVRGEALVLARCTDQGEAVLGTGVGVGAAAAAEEALLAALGTVLARRVGVVRDERPRPLLVTTRTDLVEWSVRRGLRLLGVGDDSRWADLGLHPCRVEEPAKEAVR